MFCTPNSSPDRFVVDPSPVIWTLFARCRNLAGSAGRFQYFVKGALAKRTFFGNMENRVVLCMSKLKICVTPSPQPKKSSYFTSKLTMPAGAVKLQCLYLWCPNTAGLVPYYHKLTYPTIRWFLGVGGGGCTQTLNLK